MTTEFALSSNVDLPAFKADVSATTQLAASGGSAIQGWTTPVFIWACGTLALLAWHGGRWLNFFQYVWVSTGTPATGTSPPVSGMQLDGLKTSR